MSILTKKFIDPSSGFSLDISGVTAINDAKKLENILAKFPHVHSEIQKIENGEIKNPDENRQVTHFTDRLNYVDSELYSDVENFAFAVRNGEIKSGTGKAFKNVVINGIGGSALGPQLMNFAINGPYWNELSDVQRENWLKIYFTDNTDSSGITDVIAAVNLEETLILSISKSGGTRETYNNMKVFEEVYAKAGLDFTRFAVAITMENSQLDKYSKMQNWLKIFPMAESIGGRTSETSIVGHLPAALTGICFADFLAGAVTMDDLTRNENVNENPAYMLATVWYATGNGKGDKNMVIVPYSDRLVLLSRYLQQLVMESLGKEFDLNGNIVHQGLNVFGNKGGTDAHAFIQQLNDGKNDFFISFIEILKDQEVYKFDDGFSMGDYLHCFKDGLGNALRTKNREVVDITLNEIDAFNLGMIIALYERTVAAYAEMININAFHQPGVQAYKLAAGAITELWNNINKFIKENKHFEGSAVDFAKKIGSGNPKDLDGILGKIAFNTNLIERKFCEKNNDWIYTIL